MAFKIVISNDNENQFSINGGSLLEKGVYVNSIKDGDKVGLINKLTKKTLIDNTHFSNWETKTGLTFNSLDSLIEYLTTYIEVKGKNNSEEVEETELQKINNKLDMIMDLFGDMLTELEAINSNTTP